MNANELFPGDRESYKFELRESYKFDATARGKIRGNDGASEICISVSPKETGEGKGGGNGRYWFSTRANER